MILKTIFPVTRRAEELNGQSESFREHIKKELIFAAVREIAKVVEFIRRAPPKVYDREANKRQYIEYSTELVIFSRRAWNLFLVKGLRLIREINRGQSDENRLKAMRIVSEIQNGSIGENFDKNALSYIDYLGWLEYLKESNKHNEPYFYWLVLNEEQRSRYIQRGLNGFDAWRGAELDMEEIREQVRGDDEERLRRQGFKTPKIVGRFIPSGENLTISVNPNKPLIDPGNNI